MTDVELKAGDGQGRFALHGSLNADSVPALWQQAGGAFQGARELDIDLSAVERADSAGLALLVEWTRQARQNGQRIRFLNLPEQLLAIARVSGLDTMLPFSTGDRGTTP